MANCCTNTASKVSTHFTWAEAKDATEKTIETSRDKQFGGKMYFWTSYNYVIEKSTDSKFDGEKLKAMVCALKTMIDEILNSKWAFISTKNDNYDKNQNNVEKWKKTIESLCDDISKNVVKNEKVEITTIKGCMDEKYTEYNPKATKDDGSCKVLIKPKKPKLVPDCMDDGEGLPKNVTVTNYNPDANVNFGCKYSTPIVVKNNYMFCTDLQDGTFNGCSPEEAKGIMDGYITPRTYKVIADTPTRTNNIRASILNIVTKSISSHPDIPYIPIRNENKFTKAFNQTLIDDITDALTVSVVETQFKRSEDDPEFQVYPFTYVTVYSPQGATDPITEFNINRNTAIDAPVGIVSISPVDSAVTFKKRLANIPGIPTVNPNLVNAINKHIVSSLKLNIRFDDEGILQENRIPNVGLGKVLYKEPIGLGKLIK